MQLPIFGTAEILPYIRSLLIGMLKPWITSSPSEVTSAAGLAWHFLVSMGRCWGG